MKSKVPPPVDLGRHQALCTSDPYASNRLLFDWLCDDERRAQLYGALGAGPLDFKSRFLRNETDDKSPRPHAGGHADARLITDPSQIEIILRDSSGTYSTDPYAQLGSGSFMLALDPKGSTHGLQREIAGEAFRLPPDVLRKLCVLACRSAAVTTLRRGSFNLAEFAEQTALRFCSDLFGFALKDYVLIEAAARRAYKGLSYVNFARHFVTEPTLIPEARGAMAALLRRTAELMDDYQRCDPRPDDVTALEGELAGFEPVLKRLARWRGKADFNGQERAVLVVGSIAGIVGNIQASVCIAVHRMFRHDRVVVLQQALEVARANAREAHQPLDSVDEQLPALLWPDIVAAMCEHPPVPLLPRRLKGDGRQLLLAIGAATRTAKDDTQAEALVFGGMPFGTHWCLGRHLAQPLILAIVRHVLCLPGLDERLDPLDGTPIGIAKAWAFRCESYPLIFRSGDRFAHQSLNVAMRVKPPFRECADALRQVIRVAAPRIDTVLREAAHVHFAWFEFIDNDKQLVLHTIFDGEFEAYILHFAEVAGDLFDQLFEHLEDAPPRPVADYPYEFLDTIRRYNRPPAVHYLFSAYPQTEAAAITRLERSRP